MTPELRQTQRFLALDPARSAAVEACAGSGKTWLLSARLLRLLLAGVRPAEILAITYTRKAAREIEARLRCLLAELAVVPVPQALAMLVERGLNETEARAALPRARGLFEAVLQAEPAITITTFHGWFARLLSGAPLQSGVAGRTLDEAAGSLLDEAWGLLAAACARAPEDEVAQSLLWLYEALGAANTRKLLKALVERRAEWQLWAQSRGGADSARATLDAAFGAGQDPLADCFTSARLDELEAFARLLGQNAASDQALGNALAQAVVDLKSSARPVSLVCGEGASGGAGFASPDKGRSGGVSEPPACSFGAKPPPVGAKKVLGRPGDFLEREFDAIRAAFLTRENKPRARKSTATQAKRLGAGEETFLALHAQWSARLMDALDALQDQRNALFNQHGLRVGEALLGKLAELKRARRVMDFGDLEAEIDTLLSQEGSAAWLQARLDARYRHILLDEFQDTNPLQWRILRGWLDAYDASAGRPGVFLVGDPKQSIYRFRRAEPRLFSAAADYFEREFGAVRLQNAHTYRNAAGIVALVNQVFEIAAMPGFVPQSTERSDWPARVECLPLIAAAAPPAVAPAEGMRLPLEMPRLEEEDQRRVEEAALLARRLREIVGCWLVRDKSGERPARYADVLILTRRKTHLATYETALREAGIPFVSPGRGGLLATLEAQDLLAVLRFLADPADNLALAHTLRTPGFALSDADLLAISAQSGLWWPVLRRLAGEDDQPGLRRTVVLLEGWLDASAHLPAHDLIDRIFHESDWFARARAQMPAAQWPGVHANLEALLELALQVDGGRYPSLTRFVDELRRLSSADEEAPDEGLVASNEQDAGRVRIMTVHGAKGLEAPIVWLIDANAPSRPAEGYTVAMDWPVDASTPAHVSLLGKISEVGALRREMLAAEAAAAEREELNLLYVAITRAEQVFIVSGSESARAPATTPWQRVAAGLAALGAGESVYGSLPQCASAEPPAAASPSPVSAERPRLRIGKQRPLAPLADVSESQAGMLFGTAMHAWLEAHCAGWPLPTVAPEVQCAAQAVLSRPALARFFDAASYLRAGNETAFLDATGELRRMDRWVEFEDAIWVLDYKSGHLPAEPLLADYRQQLNDYRSAMQYVFPHKPLRAMLVFADGGELVLE